MRANHWIALAAVASTACYGGASVDVETDGGTDDAGDSGGGGSDAGDSSGGGEGPGDPQDVPEGSVPAPLVARLTHAQYAYAIEDLLGVTLTDEEIALVPRDLPVGSAYSSGVQSQFFNAQYVLAYARVARSVVERVGADALLAEHGGCTLAQAECLETFVDTLGQRTHRRPLNDAQRSIYLELADAVQAEGEAPDAVVAIAEAMLQAPAFLYRLEDERSGDPGEVYRVDGYELASRLSFFFWQSGPDDALLAFAAGAEDQGTYDADALGQEIDRMLADPRFGRSRRQFWGDYTLASVAGFSAADPAVREELRESLLATLDRVSGVDTAAQSLDALFVGDEMVMTPAVAELAGATPQGEGLQVYSAAEADMRGGVLRHPAFLSAMGTTSFVGRGLFLTERVLCQHIAAPPSDEGTSNAIMDTAMQTEGLTPRGASEFRFGLEPACLFCHTQFEPIAYAFERYDMVGRYTLTDEEGRDLFSDGVLPSFVDRPEISFADADALLGGLAETDAAYACMVENMMEYATGFQASQARDSVAEAADVFEEQGRTFEALVRSVAENQQLTFKRTAEDEG